MADYRTRKVCVSKGHPLFSYCENITSLACNLYNAARFRQRQAMTASKKAPSELTANEKEVIDEFRRAGEPMPENGRYPSRRTIEAVMRACGNPDFFAEGLPRQSAQHVLIKADGDMESFFKAIKDWKANPGKFLGKPELPGYKRKGGHATVEITNQDCTVREDRDGNYFAGFPFMKKCPLCIGPGIRGRLKNVTIKPVNGVYEIGFVFETASEEKIFKEKPLRAAGIDFGVGNLMAVTNNCGLPCLLYKGGIVKSINRKYNKDISSIMEAEMKKPGCPLNRKGLPVFAPTPASMALTVKRDHSLKDFMYKAACHFTAWCVENRIDTVVAGVSRSWKQKSGIGKENNQNFVQIPFAFLRNILSYKLEEHGIRYIEQEESYTSRASFLDGDFIPTYGINDADASFSGKRHPSRYKGMYKKNGFRGLYRSHNGVIINADLNGSANILRKAIQDIFVVGKAPDFFSVCIIKNPDLEFTLLNKQAQASSPCRLFSNAKRKRLNRKAAA